MMYKTMCYFYSMFTYLMSVSLIKYGNMFTIFNCYSWPKIKVVGSD